MGEGQMRSGFTTGTCAAVAAKAAAVLLLSGERPEWVTVMTPKGTAACLRIEERAGSQAGGMGRPWAQCAVRKDAGDDPDVTHGALVYAKVQYIDDQEEDLTWYESPRYPWLRLAGGQGIGRVTKPGLQCPVGKAAINPVPREMIFDAVGGVCRDAGVSAPLLIGISIPDGIRLAEKTFNPKLGITGGISVLGTSGVVEPMSEAALVETIRLEIHMRAVEGAEILLLTPGNYGEEFLTQSLGISLGEAVKCSNFVEEALRYAAAAGFERILFAGHLGKLVKVAGGVKNTHSRYGDRRMEILWDCARASAAEETGARTDLRAWADLRERILGANTTEEALAHLEGAGVKDLVLAEAVRRIRFYAVSWTGGKSQVEVVTFSTVYGILGMTDKAADMIAALREIRQKNGD